MLGRGGGSPGGAFAAATGLGFAGFFFSLLKPMLRMGGQPAIRQQGFQGSRVAGGDERFTNSDKANELLARERREGFGLPEV